MKNITKNNTTKNNIVKNNIPKKIGVVGAGIAGLSCAYELQKAGYDVVVFEKNDYVGGRMASRAKKGLLFDIGANFLIDHYQNTKEYCEELGVQWEQMEQGTHCTFRGGKYYTEGLNSLWSLLNFSTVSLFSRLKLLYLFYDIGKHLNKFNFFDLSTTPKEFDKMTAYDYAMQKAGKEVADYIIDGFTSTYQFHRANEISLSAMLSMISLMANKAQGFTICHMQGGMSAIPEAIAKKVPVYLKKQVYDVFGGDKVVVIAANKKYTLDAVVLASTANFSNRIYKNPSYEQKQLLDSVKYATTVNVSYKIPADLFGKVWAVTVPFVENKAICEYTNESKKGERVDGKTIVNVGLHEEFAKSIIGKPDKEIYELVKAEFIKVCPPLNGRKEILENYDLQRWPEAMPKFDYRYVSKVKDFWENGQGDNNIYFCGDYLNTPWIEGGITCGKKVAKSIISRESGK